MPLAWAKLVFPRDRSDTQVGGFGVSAENDWLLVTDLCLVGQRCTPAAIEFDDPSIANFFDEQIELGRRPDQFARICVLMQPGDSPLPSSRDEQMFHQCCGRVDWAVIFVLSQEGDSHARLRFNAGPGGSIVLPVEVDFEQPFAGPDYATWADEYDRNVICTCGFRSESLHGGEPLELAHLPEDFHGAWSHDVAGEDGRARQEGSPNDEKDQHKQLERSHPCQ